MGHGHSNGPGERLCETCKQPLTLISQYERWYCYNCKTYADGAKRSSGNSGIVPEKSKFLCSTCGDSLFFIKDYASHFCYKCNAYQEPDIESAPIEGGEVTDIPGHEPHDETGLTCPDCGVEVDSDWIRCPNCASALPGEMNEEPVTIANDEPDHELYQEGPAIEDDEVRAKTTEPAPERVMRSDPRDEDEWGESADAASHDWKASASEVSAEREMAAQEERSDWEGSAKAETSSWRSDAHQEKQEWTDEAEAQEAQRNETVELERADWEQPKRSSKIFAPKVELPDEHGDYLDQEVEFLIDMFQEILCEFLKEPMEPISFYRSKLKALSKKFPVIRKIKVNDDGKIQIFVEENDFEKVLVGLSEVFDNLVLTEAKITSKSKAMARAKAVLEPIIEEYEEELEDFGIIHRLLKGAFAPRLTSGIPGFDDMLHGGIPNGASIIVQGATGGEKEMFANQFLAEGLKTEGSIMVVVSMISPGEWRSQMKSIKTKTRKYEKEGQIIIVDWYTHKNERVRSVETRGSVILSSKSITNAEISIDKAIKVIRDAPTKRAVIAILSPAIKSLGFDKVYGFAQSIRGKFKKYGITGMFLLEKKMHDERVMTSLHSVFDGIFDIERQRIGDAMVRKIGVLSLKGVTFDSSYRELELTREGLSVKRK